MLVIVGMYFVRKKTKENKDKNKNQIGQIICMASSSEDVVCFMFGLVLWCREFAQDTEYSSLLSTSELHPSHCCEILAFIQHRRFEDTDYSENDSKQPTQKATPTLLGNKDYPSN